jgi:hypothetical protein
MNKCYICDSDKVIFNHEGTNNWLCEGCYEGMTEQYEYPEYDDDGFYPEFDEELYDSESLDPFSDED